MTPNSFADVVEDAGSRVVRIHRGRRRSTTGTVWSDDGLIVCSIGLTTGDQVDVSGADLDATAECVGYHAGTDLALLRLAGTSPAPLERADLEQLRVGDWCLALAHPGVTVRAAAGILGTYGGAYRTAHGTKIERYVHADLNVWPGFSGGPLVTAAGALVGINTTGIMHRTQLTVPHDTVERVVDGLLRDGGVRRGYLGVMVQSVRLPRALREELGQKRGLMLVSVAEDAPAATGGLTLGDVVVRIAGQGVQQVDHLLDVLDSESVGGQVLVEYLRGGVLHTAEIVVGAHPADLGEQR